MHVQRGSRARRRFLAPHPENQPVAGDDAIHFKSEHGEYGTPLDRTDRDLLAMAVE